MQSKNSLKGAVILFITAIIWGIAFVFQAESTIGTFWFNGIRFFIGMLSLIPVIFIFERKILNKPLFIKTLMWGSITGLLLFTASTLQMVGIVMTHSSGKAGFITGLYMILVPFFCALLFRDKIHWNAITGAVLGAVGLFLICMMNESGFHIELGDIFVLLGSVFWAFHIITVDKRSKTLPSVTFSAVQFLTVAIISIIVAPFIERDIVINGTTLLANLSGLLYCGIMSSGVAYTCQIIGQKYMEPGPASIIMCTESVWAAVAGAVMLQENLGWMGYVGCVLIFGGILLTQIQFKFKNDQAEEKESNER